jgi:hypothetical protein
MIRVARPSEDSIERKKSVVLVVNSVAATDGRAVLQFATRSLLDWNDLVWHHLVYRVARVLDRS